MPERDALTDRLSERREPQPEAQRLREHAAMLRELAQAAAAPSIASKLLAVAEEFEQQAARLES